MFQDVTSGGPKLTLRAFRLAVLRFLPQALPGVVEALYVLLQVLKSGDDTLQSPTDVGISIDLVNAYNSPVLFGSSLGDCAV